MECNRTIKIKFITEPDLVKQEICLNDHILNYNNIFTRLLNKDSLAYPPSKELMNFYIFLELFHILSNLTTIETVYYIFRKFSMINLDKTKEYINKLGLKLNVIVHFV